MSFTSGETWREHVDALPWGLHALVEQAPDEVAEAIAEFIGLHPMQASE